MFTASRLSSPQLNQRPVRGPLGLRVDGVPNQLHHRTQGISFVGESANVIVHSL